MDALIHVLVLLVVIVVIIVIIRAIFLGGWPRV